ncbi:MAG: HlyC/CorC family transporter [Deltaproteobacteria bacterium]|nr:HlyC/CorC family transporter [Deltaproteobacteria bacterium]
MANERDNSTWKTVLDWLSGRGRQDRDLVKEMEELIEEGTAEGVLNEEQEEMLLSVLSFRQTMVREVMVPRTEMVCFEVSEPLDELVRKMVEEGHSRIPLYEEDVEHVVGFVAARDVLRFWDAPPPHPPLTEMLRPAFFVPETMNLGVLLSEFRRRRIHLAIVVDEYGGLSGLATLEDVLEQIVGDIWDEYDDEVTEIRASGDGFSVDARTEIETLEEHLGMDLAVQGEFETAGGLVFQALGRIPKPGEVFVFRGLEITVQDADKRRVKELMIRRIASEEQHGENGDSEAKP